MNIVDNRQKLLSINVQIDNIYAIDKTQSVKFNVAENSAAGNTLGSDFIFEFIISDQWEKMISFN